MSKPPITSWEQLHQEMVTRGLKNGKGVTIRKGSIHEVDASDIDLLELGSRVEEELG